MEPWYKVANLRKEVREGRSFNPDEFAIHLEQVIAGTAPEDYRDAAKFFSRTCFTSALSEHVGMVLRRLNGQTANTSPVMTLVTQFGGGKTHALATLFHIAKHQEESLGNAGVQKIFADNKLSTLKEAHVAAFVGNAWDPRDGKETPWLDLAFQIAGEKGIAELGKAAKTTPPGTEALARIMQAANAPVLILFDEVLNFMNRHRGMAEQFHAFIQNLTVATTGVTNAAAVISLPRSQVEMTDWDTAWQEKITKVVRRVAKDLLANDEAEISEVIRKRLFDDIGDSKVIKSVSKTYSDWCFERKDRLPPEWTMVDSAATEAKAKDYLRGRFEACYPFHPATLSVFQRKWRALKQYQQTRGTLAMLAQWISWAFKDGFTNARREPLITIGSAPLEVNDFRSVVLGQLGEATLEAAIMSDIAGAQSHSRALDADSKGALRDIHRRVGTTILFESSGGQIDKVARIPEIRFALGEPDVETTSIDNACMALESKAYFVRPIGSDGFNIYHKPTLKKVVNDRRASLDETDDIIPVMNALVKKEFEKGATVPIVPYPSDGTAVQDSPRLTLVLVEPRQEWTGNSDLKKQIAEWTTQRGNSPRLYPGALVWCFKKPGRDLKEKIETWLAWKKVHQEINEGSLGADFDKDDLINVRAKIQDSEDDSRDEVWAAYRFVVLSDSQEPDGLRIIDLGAGHAGSTETLCGRIISALKSNSLLSESVGSGYIERNWPNALKEAGAWPMSSLRQCFLNGSLTRLLDPDHTLRVRISEAVQKGDFGFASGQLADGTYQRVWFNEAITLDEITFDSNVFLLTKARAGILVATPTAGSQPTQQQPPLPATPPTSGNSVDNNQDKKPLPRKMKLIIIGEIPHEVWNRFGQKVLTKLRTSSELRIKIECEANMSTEITVAMRSDLEQIINDLGLSNSIRITEQ